MLSSSAAGLSGPESFGFRKVCTLTAGGASADIGLRKPDQALSDDSGSANAGVPKISDGLIFDTERNVIFSLDDIANKTDVSYEKGFIPADFKLLSAAPNGDKKIFFLFERDGGSYICIGEIKRSGKSVEIKTADMKKVTGPKYSKFVDAGDEHVVLLSSSGALLTKFKIEIDGREIKKCEIENKTSIDYCGAAAADTAGGKQYFTLRANAGAVNTVMTYNNNLDFALARMVLNGETGGVRLEAALPEKTLLACFMEPGPDGRVVKSYMLFDSFGAVYDAFKINACPFMDQISFNGDMIIVADHGAPDDKGIEKLTIYSMKTADFLSGVFGRKQAVLPSGKIKNASIKNNNVNFGKIAGPFGVAVSRDGRVLLAQPLELTFDGAGIDAGSAGRVLDFISESKGIFELFTGRDGKFHIYSNVANAIVIFNIGENKKIENFEKIKLDNLKETFEIALSSPDVDKSGEIFISDFNNFSTYKFMPDGKKFEKIINLAGLSHGYFGETFFVSEGRTASHKVLLEYDNHGNFMRELGDVELSNANMRSGGAVCLGKDLKNRVVFIYFVKNSLRIVAYDYKSGKIVKNAVAKFDFTGIESAGRGFHLTDEGVIIITAAVYDKNNRDRHLEIYSIDISSL